MTDDRLPQSEFILYQTEDELPKAATIKSYSMVHSAGSAA